MNRALAIAGAAAMLLPRVAAAQADLELHALPSPEPTTLAIRAADDRAPPPPQKPAKRPARASPPATAQELFELNPLGRRELSDSDRVGQQRSLDERVIFRFNIGFGLDGGTPSETGELISGHPLEDPMLGYERLRPYTFGDAVAGTRGFGLDSINTYFATAFRFDQVVGSPAFTGVPSIQDNSEVPEVRVRSAYAEAEQFTENRWLRPLYVRAGRMFQYGPAVAHFSGVDAGYKHKSFRLALWGGERVSLWGFNGGDNGIEDGSAVYGSELEIDFYQAYRFPAVVTFRSMHFDGTDHTDTGVAYQYNPNVQLRASLRAIDSDAARQNLTLRARVSSVTTVYAELDNRTRNDWVYDLLVADSVYPQTDPRIYLNLGEPLPRTMLRVRAGTVLLDALDVLLSGAAAVEHGNDAKDVPSAFSPSYFEAGAAVDVRIRRAIRVGTSFEARRYRRQELALVDMPADTDPLPPDTSSMGERGFIQGGARVNYSTGARGFNADFEFYARAYSPQSPYIPVDELSIDNRIGGRFGVESWLGSRLRLKGVYDVSGSLDPAPELTGVKSLRVIMEGTF